MKNQTIARKLQPIEFMKTSNINTLAIGIFAIALVIFFGCSDNSSGSEKPSLADLAENFQVYMEDDCPGTCPFSPFAGNGVIRIGVYDMDDGDKIFKDFIPFGTVKKGKGTLDFSVEIPNIYLESDGTFSADALYLISGNNAYSLEQYYESQTKYESVIYTYDIQGWSAIYSSATRNSVKKSTDPSTVNLSSMKWQASYRGSATFFGGPDAGSIDPSYGDYCVFFGGARCVSIQELNEMYGYAVSCEYVLGGGIPVHSCPETIDGYCTRNGFCSPFNDRECNYWGGSFSLVKPPDCDD